MARLKSTLDMDTCSIMFFRRISFKGRFSWRKCESTWCRNQVRSAALILWRVGMFLLGEREKQVVSTRVGGRDKTDESCSTDYRLLTVYMLTCAHVANEGRRQRTWIVRSTHGSGKLQWESATNCKLELDFQPTGFRLSYYVCVFHGIVYAEWIRTRTWSQIVSNFGLRLCQ
jgi:hypothetical protein